MYIPHITSVLPKLTPTIQLMEHMDSKNLG